MAWAWRYEGGEGQKDAGTSESFPSQSDAESWLGQSWRELVSDRCRHGRARRGRAGRVPDEPAAGGRVMVDRRVARAGSGRAFRPSPVFLGLVALWVTGGAMAWYEYGSPTFNVILFVLAGWLVSLSLHEYAHALYAFHSGDRAVADRGYLTLNPLKYTHPVLSIGCRCCFCCSAASACPAGRSGWTGTRCRVGSTPPDQCGRSRGERRVPVAHDRSVRGRAFTRGRTRRSGGGRVPGVPAAHRGGAQPDADPRRGRRQHPPAVALARRRSRLRPDRAVRDADAVRAALHADHRQLVLLRRRRVGDLVGLPEALWTRGLPDGSVLEARTGRTGRQRVAPVGQVANRGALPA